MPRVLDQRKKDWTLPILFFVRSVLFAVFFPCGLANADENGDMVIEIMPRSSSEIEVTYYFSGDQDGVTSFTFPPEWAGVQPRQAFGDIRTSPGADLSIQGDQIELWHTNGAQLVMTYVLNSAKDAELPNAHYLPAIDADRVFLIGHTAFLLPTQSPDSISLRVSGFSDSWQFVNSVESGKFAPNTIAQLRSGVVFGAPGLVVETQTYTGGVLTLATLPNSRFDLHRAGQAAHASLAELSSLWPKAPKKALLVMLPLDEKPGVTVDTGVALGATFAAFSSAPKHSTMIGRTIAHEFAHNWIGPSLGFVNESGNGLDWFIEGFTEYYAQISRLRAGQISLGGFVESINDALEQLAVSPYGGYSVDDLRVAAYEDARVRKVLYHRGMLLALAWDSEIRKQSVERRSLDQAMGEILATLGTKEAPFGEHVIISVMQSFGIESPGDDIRRLKSGNTPILPHGVFSDCALASDVSLPVYDLGFTFESGPSFFNILTVDEDGPAFAAGLRANHAVRSFSSTGASVDANVTLIVNDTGTKEKSISYRPVSEHLATTRRYVVADALGDGCMNLFQKTDDTKTASGRSSPP